mmetsp:Transcript_43402/g.85628  ORF Transcript_43402/g.85628 Transcript_43402/m.85628 type:complete len:177 (-) Transcript_43402:101-631(-)
MQKTNEHDGWMHKSNAPSNIRRERGSIDARMQSPVDLPTTQARTFTHSLTLTHVVIHELIGTVSHLIKTLFVCSLAYFFFPSDPSDIGCQLGRLIVLCPLARLFSLSLSTIGWFEQLAEDMPRLPAYCRDVCRLHYSSDCSRKKEERHFSLLFFFPSALTSTHDLLLQPTTYTNKS